jgi:hypothetical protein
MGDQVCFSYHNISSWLAIKVEALANLRIRIMPRHKVMKIYSHTRWKTFESQGHVFFLIFFFWEFKGFKMVICGMKSLSNHDIFSFLKIS